jgi:hypothetical protein
MNLILSAQKRIRLFFWIALLCVAAPLRGQEVCKDSQVPEGWTVVNDRHDDSKCGPSYSTVRNVWIIEKFSARMTAPRWIFVPSSQIPGGGPKLITAMMHPAAARRCRAIM